MGNNYSYHHNFLIRSAYLFLGIIVLGSVIIIHELGHWFMCTLYGVDVPTFSVGFGPIMYSFPIAHTIFEIALFPFGGFVVTDPTQLASQSYITQLIILSGGIIANIVIGSFIFLIIKYDRFFQENQTYSFWYAPIYHVSKTIQEYYSNISLAKSEESSIIGPLGIIHLISKSIAAGPRFFLSTIASLNIGIGLFNMMPLPFLDGGKIVTLTINQWIKLPEQINIYSSYASLVIIVLFIIMLSIYDLKRIFTSN